MSKESKDVRVRRAIGKWQQVFIWIIALAFVAGIVLWAFAVNYTPGVRKLKRTLEETVAYLTEAGQALKNQTYWVFPEEVEQRFGEILSAYGNPQLDTYIEVPYVKTLITIDLLNTKSLLYYAELNNIRPDKNEVSKIIKEEISKVKKDSQKMQEIKTKYGSLSNYEKELKRQKEEELTIKAVKEKLAGIKEEEVKKYYEQNKEKIINDYTSAEVDYVVLESKEEMDNFVKLAMEKGLTEAASESSVIITPYTLKKGTLPEELEKEIFDATSTLVSLPYNESYFVFNVKSIQKVDSYESFKNSAAYDTVKANLINERFAENFKKWKEEKKVSFELRDAVYRTWYDALTTETKDLLTMYKKMYEEFFDEAGEVRTDLPIEQKTAFLVVADRIVESTDTTYEVIKADVKEFEKKLVQSVYEVTKGSSKEILRRMKEYNPDRKDIAYNYYSKLYDEIKPYLQFGMFYYVMNDLFAVYQGFAELAENEAVDKQIRADAIYKLYTINKDLKEIESAKSYLKKLKELMPDYKLDFDRAEKELEDLSKQMETNGGEEQGSQSSNESQEKDLGVTSASTETVNDTTK